MLQTLLLSRVLLDYTVWDNDAAYALVTIVSIAFTILLIVMVSRQSRMHDQAQSAARAMARSRARKALVHESMDTAISAEPLETTTAPETGTLQ